MAEPPRLGWKGVRPDYRDEPYRFKNALKAELAAPAELPPSSRPQWREVEAMPILDQGLSSACTGYGTAPMAAVERNVTMRSPDAIYRAARAAIGELDRDEGAYGHDAVAYAVQEGAPAHRLWPSKLGADGKPIHLWEAPSARALADAAKRKLFTYHGLATGQEFRSCLQRHTFAIGISCYDNLFDPLTERFGIVQMPAGDYQGGHWLWFNWYDDNFRQSEYAFWAKQNGFPESQLPERVYGFNQSWGVGWGRQGRGVIPAEYLESRYLAGDGQTLRGFADENR